MTVTLASENIDAPRSVPSPMFSSIESAGKRPSVFRSSGIKPTPARDVGTIDWPIVHGVVSPSSFRTCPLEGGLQSDKRANDIALPLSLETCQADNLASTHLE